MDALSLSHELLAQLAQLGAFPVRPHVQPQHGPPLPLPTHLREEWGHNDIAPGPLLTACKERKHRQGGVLSDFRGQCMAV